MADGTAGKSALIIGASRGIGLGLARELAGRGWRVFASERSRSDGLHALADDGSAEILTIDVTRPETYTDLPIEAGSLDCMLLNAGISGTDRVEDAGDGELADIMLANAFGPARAARALLPLVKDGGVLGFTSSVLGSIAQAGAGYELYGASKAAQNMLAGKVFAADAKPRGIAVLSLHPGWVATDMGGKTAPVSVADSARGLADVLSAGHDAAHHYLTYQGERLPW